MIPAKAFYLIRHGETEANASHITAGGELDTPLTRAGQQQARNIAQVIHQLEIKASKIIHSPMSRAKDTADLINDALKLAMHKVDDFREHIVGEWEGKPWEEVRPHLEANVRPVGGENKDDFGRRVKQVLTNTLETHNDPVMIVAHGGIFYSILHLYEQPFDHNIQNCHLHYFEPCNDHGAFPWRVWQFDIEDDNLVKSPAPFCSTHYTDKTD